jgi:hypothetical protein
VGANSASTISNTPSGNISATNVQAAINELDSEKLSSAPGAVTSANLNNVVTAGTAGAAGAVPVITYDAKGRITGMSTALIAALGIGQTTQDVTASRAINTTYTNSSGRTKFVTVVFNVNSSSLASLRLGTDDVAQTQGGNAAHTRDTLYLMVEPDAEYSARVLAGTPSIVSWHEL